MALSASSLGTKYLNEYFIVTRAATNPETGEVISTADYSELGYLLITVTIIVVVAPLVTILLVQNSKYRTAE